MTDSMQVYFKVPVEIKEKDGRYIASCFLVDTHSEGPTKHEALDALTEAVHTFMTTSARKRELDSILHRHDLRLPDQGEELATGRYIDVSIQLKIPAQTPK